MGATLTAVTGFAGNDATASGTDTTIELVAAIAGAKCENNNMLINYKLKPSLSYYTHGDQLKNNVKIK